MHDTANFSLKVQNTSTPKPIVKLPKKNASASNPKVTTAKMVTQALKEMDSKKGVSIQAIKKYMKENFGADSNKTTLYLKRHLKLGIEKGTIVQTSGIGATGSFKLKPAKVDKTKSKSAKTDAKPPKEDEKPAKKSSKTNKKDVKTSKTDVKADKNAAPKAEKKENKGKSTKLVETETKPKKQKKSEELKEKVKKLKRDVALKLSPRKVEKEKVQKTTSKSKKNNEEKIKKTAKRLSIVQMNTTAKSSKMSTKRKSLGSIIKPPRMKPKKPTAN